MKETYLTAALALAASLILLPGCSSQPEIVETDDTAKVFEVKGRLRSIATDGQSATIEHEHIPNYMPAMTMPFYVKHPAELAGIKPGAPIGFRFVVTESDSWIEAVRQLTEDAVPQSPAGESARKSALSGRIPALEPGEALPNFRLTNQDGERFQFSDFAGKHVVLTFIFTRCPVPNFCPLMSENFRKLQALVDEAGRENDVRLLSITIDPDFDTPEMLRLYASRYGADTSRWIFATGSAGEIDELTARFSVYIEPEAGTISHGLATAHITPDGTLAQIWRGNGWTPQDLFEALNNKPRLALNYHTSQSVIVQSKPSASVQSLPELRDATEIDTYQSN